MNLAVDCHMVASPIAGDAGNGRYAAALVRSLARTGTPGDWVSALVTGTAAAEAVGPGVAPVLVHASGVRRLIASADEALRAMGADVGVFTYVAPVRTRVPILVAVHDPTFVTNPEWLGRRARWVLNTAGLHSAREAAGVLALSATAKADICAALGLDPDRVHVVSPFPAPAFHPADGAADRVRVRWGVSRYVLAVGDVGPRKNLGSLAAAMRLLGDPGLELVLVGRPGVQGESILADVRARWLGAVTDEELADLYRAAAVTAHPSRYEGFGLTVLEALACGSPVVAAAAGALPEVVGDAGILVAPEPAPLAEGLRAALEPGTADGLRTAGPVRAARFTPQAMGEAAWDAAHAVAR